MINKIRGLLIKYKELIVYAIFGVLTTLVNFATYFLLTRLAKLDLVIGKEAVNAIAIITSIIFAYVTNRKFVFCSKVSGLKNIAKEAGSFFLARGLSFFLDMGIFYLFVTILFFNDLLIKILSNILIIIINYVVSKLWIFKKKKPEENADKSE